MSVLAPERNIEERLSAMAGRLGRANDRIEALEDQLVAARSRVREADKLRAKTELQLTRAKEKAVSSNPSRKSTGSNGWVVIDGTPRAGLNKTEAAGMLGVSVDFFDHHIARDLKCVRRGRRRIYAVTEVQAWLDREGESVGPGVYSP